MRQRRRVLQQRAGRGREGGAVLRVQRAQRHRQGPEPVVLEEADRIRQGRQCECAGECAPPPPFDSEPPVTLRCATQPRVVAMCLPPIIFPRQQT